ncbi:MAG: UbiD family decarboxylase, partial [Firmicutes bacterium]|nr:UbiD family decarboxylase [Bacillota bacterium]
MNQINDLRSALDLLKTMENQFIETDIEIDPMNELAGLYRKIGAGGTVMRPTKEGPAAVFNRIKGYPEARIAIGL